MSITEELAEFFGRPIRILFIGDNENLIKAGRALEQDYFCAISYTTDIYQAIRALVNQDFRLVIADPKQFNSATPLFLSALKSYQQNTPLIVVCERIKDFVERFELVEHPVTIISYSNLLENFIYLLKLFKIKFKLNYYPDEEIKKPTEIPSATTTLTVSVA
jgi:hypothetical protein